MNPAFFRVNCRVHFGEGMELVPVQVRHFELDWSRCAVVLLDGRRRRLPVTPAFESERSKMNKPKKASERAIPVRTYDELERYVRAFAAGHLNLLIVVGGPGLAKSQTVRRLTGERSCWIEGNATAFGMYVALWRHKDELVIIDDVDNLYGDRPAVRLLKCLCQTDPVKHVAWQTGSSRLEREGVPKSFETRSRVALIANDWRTLNGNVEAVEDRGHVIVFEPTPEEVHWNVVPWFRDREILEWFQRHLHLVHRPSMRHYVRAAELKKAGLNWMQAILSDTLSEKTLLVARIKADSKYTNERQRVEAFGSLGGGCRATYFNHARRLNGSRVQGELPVART